MAGGQPRGQLVAAVFSEFHPVTEESVVDNWLLSQEAERMGMVVTDEEVNQFWRGLPTTASLSRSLRSST